jgi:hypothetical protein
MSRPYSPRQSTVDLMARIGDHPNILRVHSVAPNAHRGALIRLYWANGRHDDLTLPEAREFVAAMVGIPARPRQSVEEARAIVAARTGHLYRLADADGNVVSGPFVVPGGAVVVRFYDADGAQVGSARVDVR